MEQQTELDMFYKSPYFLDIIVKRMLMELDSPTDKFIFSFVFLLGHKQNEAAEVLAIHETNISRHIRAIRQRLDLFRDGYDDTTKKWNDTRCSKRGVKKTD